MDARPRKPPNGGHRGRSGARCVTPDPYWIFLAFSKASSIVPTM